jgi:hypothetical protein
MVSSAQVSVVCSSQCRLLKSVSSAQVSVVCSTWQHYFGTFLTKLMWTNFLQIFSHPHLSSWEKLAEDVVSSSLGLNELTKRTRYLVVWGKNWRNIVEIVNMNNFLQIFSNQHFRFWEKLERWCRLVSFSWMKRNDFKCHKYATKWNILYLNLNS